MASIYKAPPEVERTKPVPRELMVVEPLAPTVNSELPVEEEITKTLVVGKVEVPWTDRVAMGLDDPTPTKPLALTVK